MAEGVRPPVPKVRASVSYHAPQDKPPVTPRPRSAAGGDGVAKRRDIRKGLFVATPAYGAACYLPYVAGMLSLQAACLERGVVFSYFFLSGTALLHEQRNVAVEAFEASGLSHMLFVDADVGFAGQDVVRMLDADEDVVLGPYPAKHINWAAVVHAARAQPQLSPAQVALYSADYSTNMYGLEGQNHMLRDCLMEVHAGGAGLMMIAREAFAQLEHAYPETQVLLPEAYRHLVPGATHMFEHFEFAREDDGRTLSEDINFCRKWRATGGRLYTATWCKTVHVGPYYFQGDLPGLLGA